MIPGIVAGGAMGGGTPVVPNNRLSVTATAFGSAATTHNVDMPGTVDANDLLVAHFTSAGNSAVTTPAGWTLLYSGVNGTAVRTGWYYKIAAGTEGGTQVNFVTASSVQAAAHVHRIEKGTYGVGLFTIFPADPASTNAPNPPEIPIPWGATQTTVFAGAATQFNNANSAYPSGFTGGYTLHSAPTTGTNAVITQSSAIRQDTLAYTDPDAFSFVDTRSSLATTLAIGPSGTPALDGPVIADTVNTAFNTNTTSHNVAMPATVNAGDLLIMAFSSHSATGITTPSGWTLEDSTANVDVRLSIMTKVAAGTEGGTTVDVVTAAVEAGAAVVIRIAAGTYTSMERTTAATGSSAIPTPAQLSPSWGTEDTLFIPVYGIHNRDTVNTLVWGYTAANSANTVAAASQNTNTVTTTMVYRRGQSWPAPLRISASRSWVAYTLGIRP